MHLKWLHGLMNWQARGLFGAGLHHRDQRKYSSLVGRFMPVKCSDDFCVVVMVVVLVVVVEVNGDKGGFGQSGKYDCCG